MPWLQTWATPRGYLITAAYDQIRKYTRRYESLIVTPYTDGAEALAVSSLDAPLDGESEITLSERISDEAYTDPSRYSQTIDYAPLHAALATLGETARAVVIHHHGLYEHAPLQLHEIDRDILKRQKAAAKVHSRALDTLHASLSSAYPQFSPSSVRPSLHETVHKYPDEYEGVPREQRILQAYALLIEQGKKPTVRTLSNAAHVDKSQAMYWLHAYRLNNEESIPLCACGCGQPAKSTPGRGKVGKWASDACRMRAKRGSPAPLASSPIKREERPQSAYARLQKSGTKVSVRRLSEEADVNNEQAMHYLRAQRAQGQQVSRHQTLAEGIQQWADLHMDPCASN